MQHTTSINRQQATLSFEPPNSSHPASATRFYCLSCRLPLTGQNSRRRLCQKCAAGAKAIEHFKAQCNFWRQAVGK
jgi:hypothetical protein